MAQTNLGRVQGAGIFMSAAASATSIALSQVSPSNVKPLPGDTVLFANGDIRLVQSVSGQSISCSEVITTLKTDLTGYATSGDLNELRETIDAALEAVKGDITSIKSDYAKKTDIPDVSKFITSIPSEYITESELTAKKYATEENLSALQTTVGNLDSAYQAADEALSSRITTIENLKISENYATKKYSDDADTTVLNTAKEYADKAVKDLANKDAVNEVAENLANLQTAANEYMSSNNAALEVIRATANSAVKSVTTGTGNGTIKVDGNDVAVKGLGSAAYTESSAYATSGHKHDNDYSKVGHAHDDRYYTESEVDAKLETKAALVHDHDGVYEPVHDHPYASETHNHDDVYSKIHEHPYADENHNHNESYYLKSEIESKLETKADDNHDHDSVYSKIHDHPYAADDHNHDGKYAPISHDHDEKYALGSHNHDERYYTESEINAKVEIINNSLSTKADNDHNHDGIYAPVHDHPYASDDHNHDSRYSLSNHNHDDRYYTESEVNAKIEDLNEAKANKDDLAKVATSGLYSDLVGAPTKVSAFENDLGYLTSHQDISGKADKASVKETTDALAARITANEGTLTTLTGSGDGSISKQIAAGVEEAKNYAEEQLDGFVAAYITADGDTIDKLEEIAEWIQNDKAGVGSLSQEVAKKASKSELDAAVLALEDQISGKADNNHNHDSVYSKIHEHPYAADDHKHDDDYAPKAHNHDDKYFTESEIDAKLETKADTTHDHDASYAPINHAHDNKYASINHDHEGVYAPIHNHPYAPENHNHDDRYYTESEVDAKFESFNEYFTGEDNILEKLDEIAQWFEGDGEGIAALTEEINNKADKNHTHTLTPTTATVVKEINGGSGDFTPTTKYLHATTGSAAPNAHTHNVTVSGTTGVNSGTAVTAVTSVGTLNGGSGNLTTNTTASTGDITFVESVTHTPASLTGTKTFNTNAIKDITLSASTTSTDGPAYVESVTHTAATLGGTKTFNTNAIKDFTLSASSTSTDGPAYVTEISGSAPSLTGTKTFVTSVGTFTPDSSDLASNTNATGGIAYIASADHTAASLGTASTSSAAPGGHTHNVTVSGTTGANDGTAVAAVTGYGSFSGGSGTLTSDTTSTNGIKYVEAVTHTAATLGGTTTFNTDAIKDVTLSASDTSTDGPKYLADVTYTPASLGTASTGTVGISGGSGTLTSDTTPTDGLPYIKTASYSNGVLTLTTEYLHHTHTAASLTGTKTFVTGYGSFSGGSISKTTKYMKHTNTKASTGTVSISGGSITPTTKYLHHTHTAASLGAASTANVAPSGHKHSYGSSTALTTGANSGNNFSAVTGYPNFSGGSASHTTKYLHYSHTPASLGAASTGTVGIKDGSYSATTKYMKHSNTAADTGTVTINGGSITPVTKYMKHTNTAADTASVGISGGSITPVTKYLHHTHTGATLSGTTTASVAPSGHTHGYGSSTALVTGANSGNAVTALTGLAANTTKTTGDITYIESATHTHNGASVKSTETVVKSVTLA